jgi:hypothetical protein
MALRAVGSGKIHEGRNPRLADKTIVFSEHELLKVVVIVTR